MEFSISKKDLLELVDTVSLVIKKDAIFPLRECILFETFSNGITLSTMSMEMSMKTFHEAPVSRATSFGVNGSTLLSVVKNLPDIELKVSVLDTATMRIHAGRKSVSLNILDGDSFPISTKYEHLTFYPAGDLFNNIDKVIYASLDEERATATGRIELSCVSINKDHVVAVDGHRLSLVPNTTPVNEEYLLPSASLAKIKKLFSSDKTEMCVTEEGAHFKAGNTVATVKSVAKAFPKYEAVIPTDPYDVASFKKSDFLEALKLVGTLADKDKKGIVLEIVDGILTVKVENHLAGKIEDSIEADFNRNVKMFFNMTYLMDVVKRIKSDVLSIEIRGELRPVVIKEDGYIHVVMPQKF